MSHKHLVSTFAVVLALLLSASGALAQTPRPQSAQSALGAAFTYQGQLKNASGPVTGNCDFQFSLWDSASDSAGQISAPLTKTLALNNGDFTVQLDFGASAFTGDARWLGIAVRCPAGSGSLTTLTPRQPVTPAPYTLYAPTSGSTSALQGQPIAMVTPASGQVLKWNGAQWAPADDQTGGGGGSAWSLAGNAGTNPGANFVGTTDGVSLTLAVNGTPALRLIPNSTSPNVIGGYSGNSVEPGKAGATIGGGGASGLPNSVLGNYGTVGGGAYNTASGSAATVGGGYQNTASGVDATIGGGHWNTASNDYATVSGGEGNIASGQYATVGGGGGNTASGGQYATIGGGAYNTASGLYATVGGGILNTASGSAATVSGGEYNTAGGNYSFVAGYRAKNDAAYPGAFLFADSNNFVFSSTVANQFRVRATGGVQFVTAIDGSGNPTAGVQVAAGGGSWSSLSDRNAKANVSAVSGRDILAQLDSIPVSTWNYKTQDAAIRHIGPMAQDFYAAFHVGEDDTHIGTVDADGVALAAIQGLHQIVQDKDAQIAAQQKEIDALKQQTTAQQKETDALTQQNTQIEARLAALEQTVDDKGASQSSSLPTNLPTGGLMLGGLCLLGLVAARGRNLKASKLLSGAGGEQ